MYTIIINLIFNRIFNTEFEKWKIIIYQIINDSNRNPLSILFNFFKIFFVWIKDKYDLIKEIGSGGFSRYLLVKNKLTKQSYACKELAKKSLSDYDGLMREINIMIELDHPNIIKLYEYYENEKNIYLIMELSPGGELFDRKKISQLKSSIRVWVKDLFMKNSWKKK